MEIQEDPGDPVVTLEAAVVLEEEARAIHGKKDLSYWNGCANRVD